MVKRSCEAIDGGIEEPTKRLKGHRTRPQAEGLPLSILEASHLVVNDSALIATLGLGRSDHEREDYLATIPHRPIWRLKEPYPPRKRYASETERATVDWFSKLKPDGVDTELADSRYRGGKRPDVEQIDRSKLQGVIPREESRTYHHEGRPEDVVFVVIRDFMRDPELLGYCGELCLRAQDERRNARRDDAGAFINVGYTAGPQNNKMLDFARNLRMRVSEEDMRETNLLYTGMCSLLWNMCRNTLPSILIDDFDSAIEKKRLPRMDCNQKGKAKSNSYYLKLREQYHEFTNGVLAPPCAGTAKNYARACHNESNGNEWMISFTCESTAPVSAGGNFYLAQYGILVEAAPNTLVAWKVRDWHGTTLPEDVAGGRVNCGVSLLIAPFLEMATRRYEMKEKADMGTK